MCLHVSLNSALQIAITEKCIKKMMNISKLFSIYLFNTSIYLNINIYNVNIKNKVYKCNT